MRKFFKSLMTDFVSIFRIRNRPDFYKTDAEKIAEDWNKVGLDMENARKNFLEENPEVAEKIYANYFGNTKN